MKQKQNTEAKETTQTPAEPMERRVTLNLNEAALVRFLPMSIGDGWFVRHAYHLLSKSSIPCPRRVSPALGGSRNAACPVCGLAKKLSASHDNAIREFGLHLCAKMSHVTSCLIFRFDPGYGEIQEKPESESLKP